MSHPDFELYDNVGRTTEQIHAYNTNTPTIDDLHRRAHHYARPFLNEVPLPSPAPVIAASRERLTQAKDTDQFNAVLDQALTGENGALDEIHNTLKAAAAWCEKHNWPEQAHRYRVHADRVFNLAWSLSGLGTEHLAAAYDRPVSRPAAPHQPAKTPGLPPATTPRPGEAGPTR
ncbi:hypothetical protein [Streptomyces sp. NBC_00690]|uniref:hypothetical protein n=1 Tax=Streptomyces sp. NBC_00690 TaxID=2975808 RepID=UPI002E2C19A7|nr:hypothetical protein [Streptomyces sp. NBC_00690]